MGLFGALGTALYGAYKASSSSSSKKTSGSSSGKKSTGVSTGGIKVNTQGQQAIKDQMTANSKLWHTSDDATKKRLEAENKQLAAQLGSGITFDSGSGTWSGTADAPQVLPAAPQVQQQRDYYDYDRSDYSDYVRQLQQAAKEKSLAELEAAYKKNVNAIDAAKGQIAPQYTDARNQVAGQAAVSRKNWQETAAAMGLNSGAAGQSDIAMNLARQNALAQLDRGESQDLAALELQRTQATTDYNSAIAKAKADGDYELAAALYQEKVRADEAARADQVAQFQQMLQKLQFEHGVSQDALAQQNWELSRQDQLAQQGWSNRFQEDKAQASQQAQDLNNLLALVSSYAESTGDYSLFGQFGFTQDQIGAWNSAWASQHAPELQRVYSAPAAGGGVSQPTSTTQGTNWRAVEDWVSLYGSASAEDYIKANYNSLGFTSQSAALAAWNNQRLESGYRSLISDLSQLRAGGATAQEINSVLLNAVNRGIISQAQRIQLQGAYIGSAR